MSDLGRRIDAAIAQLFPGWAAKRSSARLAFEASSSMYRAASRDRTRADWKSTRRKPDPPSYELETLRNRSREQNTWDGISAGATETMSVNIAGNGLQLQSRINAKDIGVSESQAEELRHQAELVWDMFNAQADAGRRLTFDEIQYLAVRKVVEDGESIILPTWIEDRNAPLARRLQIIEADRLDSRDPNFNHGIKLGEFGEPQTYSIRKPNSYTDFDLIEAFDTAGRPKILHVYRPLRPGQVRGVPLMTPVLSLFKDVAETREAWVMKERVQACLTMVLTKKGDPMAEAIRNATGEETVQNGSGRSTKNRLQNMEPGLVYYNEDGDEVSFMDPSRSAEGFEPFFVSTIRMIAASLGIPYELLMKDFSKTTYSSARAALLEGRRVFMHWRRWLAGKLCQPTYEMVMEEAFLRGMIDAPDFYAKKWAYCRAAWIGGGWGWVDPVKEIEASKNAIEYNLSTLAEEAAGQGRDYEEILQQRSREKEQIRAAGLQPNEEKQKPVLAQTEPEPEEKKE